MAKRGSLPGGTPSPSEKSRHLVQLVLGSARSEYLEEDAGRKQGVA